MSIAVTIENFSATPAYRVRHALAWRLCAPESALDAGRAAHREQYWDMAPHSRSTLRTGGDLSGDQIYGLASTADLVAVVWGRVDYEDAFGRPRQVEFTYRSGAFRIELVRVELAGGATTMREVHVCTDCVPLSYESN
jgi:hypothetical protein